MAFKRSAVRSRLSPPREARSAGKPLELKGSNGFSFSEEQSFRPVSVRLIFAPKILNQGNRNDPTAAYPRPLVRAA